MVDEEFKALIANYLKENGFKNEEEAEEKDAKEFKKNKKEYMDVAKRRVKVGIILAEIGRSMKFLFLIMKLWMHEKQFAAISRKP